MLKVTVWYVDENKDLSCTNLCNLKPRRYMCGWSFEQMIKYTKEELYWKDIDVESVSSFEIVCEKEHWVQSINKEK